MMLTYEPRPLTTPPLERRALLLDDNDGNRTLLKFVMQLSGIQHVEAETATAAFQLWKPGAFTFAFLDIELPDINGLEVLRRMRAEDPNLAIIMCSTNDDPVTILKAIKGGCDMFLVKPFQLDGLMKFAKGIDRATLRNSDKVVIIDNRARPHYEPRPGVVQ